MRIVFWTALVYAVCAAAPIRAQSAETSGSDAQASALEEAAAVPGSFFSKNSAGTVFAPRPVVGPQLPVEMFPRVNQEPMLAPEEPEEKSPALQPDASDRSAKEEAEALEKLPVRERLLKKYDDPAKDAPVLAVENAPRPFKAMMEALQLGQDDLAFQYAKQYVRHLKNLKERSVRVQSLTGFALKSEGLIEEGAWKGAPALIEDQQLYQKDLEMRKKTGAREGDIDFEAHNYMLQGKQELMSKKMQPQAAAPGVPPLQAMHSSVNSTMNMPAVGGVPAREFIGQRGLP